MIYFNLPAVKAGRLAFSNTAAGVGPLAGKPLYTMLHSSQQLYLIRLFITLRKDNLTLGLKPHV